ncbi:hypothetical protein P3T76_013058 [Phytophthora citrophthora]|uniref:Uncharacterized protein n=1 Tax=Phytophthora citrophthora TaxID=4793 RepID=A0AAD9LD74_9STRA|nr:hypothetical protein P3T76_013053 [Phytophthora citrophthora]KAK1931302.1 hypothetical protein P3T76_013058 [Phytophthora citrophthora]
MNYEVLYTLRSELAKKGISPGMLGAPVGFGSGGCGHGPWGYRHWGFGHHGPLAFANDGAFSREDFNSRRPEMGVLMEYRDKGRQRAAVGGILGASAMAGVWKAAALGSFLGVTGMIVGGAIGARVSLRTSGIRNEMLTDMLKLPSERSPRAAEAREILKKLPHNGFAQELLKGAETSK